MPAPRRIRTLSIVEQGSQTIKNLPDRHFVPGTDRPVRVPRAPVAVATGNAQYALNAVHGSMLERNPGMAGKSFYAESGVRGPRVQFLEGQYGALMTDRELTSRELDHFEGQHGMKPLALPVGTAPVAIVVNENSPLKDLSQAQLRKVFFAKNRPSWRDLGVDREGYPVPVVAQFGGAAQAVTKGLGENGFPNRVHNHADYALVRTEVNTNPDAIGIVPLSYQQSSQMKVVSVDGNQPTLDNLIKDKYEFSTPINLYVRPDRRGQIPEDDRPYYQALYQHFGTKEGATELWEQAQIFPQVGRMKRGI